MQTHLHWVRSIKEAMKELDNIDVVVVDLSLPDSNPEKTMQFVRSICTTKPVIVFSGTHDEKIIEECGRLGVGFITKACFSCNQVQRLVVELIRARGAMQVKRERSELLTESAKALGCNVAK